MTTGVDALRRCAPAAAGALLGMEAAVWWEADRSGTRGLAELTNLVCAAQHGLEPLHPPTAADAHRWTDDEVAGWRSIDGLGEREHAALDFALQFSVDVSMIADGQRDALFHHFGPAATTVAAEIFVLDFLPRTRRALDALTGPGPVPVPSPGVGRPVPSEIWSTFDVFIRAVPRLDALDPVTSELVRLRGARQHQCRVCQTRRSRPALRAGADEETFDALDRYEDSDLAPAAKAALAFTDAMIWTPGHLDATVVRGVTEQLNEPQRVELVLDVTRNALNKIAVALRGDAPQVDGGVEYFDIGADGDLIYG